MPEKTPTPGKRNRKTGTYETQPISQPDSRERKSGVALPEDQNVEANREWVQENKL